VPSQDFACPLARFQHPSKPSHPVKRGLLILGNGRYPKVVGQFELFASKKLRNINALKCL